MTIPRRTASRGSASANPDSRRSLASIGVMVAALLAAPGITACAAATGSAVAPVTGAASPSTPVVAGGAESIVPAAARPSGSSAAKAAELLPAHIRVQALQAADVAAATVPHAQVVALRLDRDDSQLVWSVTLSGSGSPTVVVVDASSGRARVAHSDASAGRMMSPAPLKTSYSAAIAKAQAAVAGSVVVRLDLVESGSRAAWDVRTLTAGPVRHDIFVDASTGAVSTAAAAVGGTAASGPGR